MSSKHVSIAGTVRQMSDNVGDISGDYYAFGDEEAEYHSDSVVPVEAARAPSPARPERNKLKIDRITQDSLRNISITRNGSSGTVDPTVRRRKVEGSHVKSQKQMPRLDQARVRKARRKTLARWQRDEEEVRLFRGNVSCVCTCMELQTDKLLPFLQEGFKNKTLGPLNSKSVSSEEGSSEDEVDGKDKPMKEWVKGEWTFRMYTDVLHAQSTFQQDELVEAARNEIQDRERERARPRRPERDLSRANRRVEPDDDDERFKERYESTRWRGREGQVVDSTLVPEIFSDGDASDDMAAPDGGIYYDSEDDMEAQMRKAAATVADLATKHVFCFEYGCLVFWGLEEDEQEFFLDAITPFQEDTVEEEERDDMTFFYGNKMRVYNDQICLATNDPLEKLSISFALAQSTKLSVLELRVEETFERTRIYPQELAETGHISLSQKSVSKLIGQLFIVRSSVNLESDMLSTPDFFWDNDQWEPMFRHAGKYLEVDARVDVLNKRMEVLDGMFQMLKDQLEVRHATRLEWIVIWLIVAEVGLELIWNIIIHDILGYFNHGSDD